jgi:primosomal protein N' (replication factor Y)
VIELVDSQAVLTGAQIHLAEKLSEECLAPLASCLALMLPPGLEQKADLLYSPVGRMPDDLTPTQSRIMKMLNERGPLRGQQIDHAMPRINWRASLGSLQQRRLVTAQPVLPTPKVHPKTVRPAKLACSPEAAQAALADLGKAGSQALLRRQGILRFLMKQSGPVEAPWIYAESGGSSQDLLFLSQRGLIVLGESQTWRDPLGQADFQPFDPPILTRDQGLAWEKVRELLDAASLGQPVSPVLLHGVTGSGKTEIYLQAVRYTLELGRQAIVLVPEIALTPQTVRRFAGRFPDQVGLVHSGLSPGERYDTWRRARQGELGLVVGPRSALFTPFEHLGLIVVDESHDDTYYQWEIQPHYHSRQAAIAYSQLVGAVCLMGTATPDITSMYLAEQGKYHYLHLPERILAHRQVVEEQMRRMTRQGADAATKETRFRPLEGRLTTSCLRSRCRHAPGPEGNRSIFSRPLQEALKGVLDQDQQAILFLNRRGSATFVFCRDCGHTLRCPRCELPLTFHETEQVLRCHYCGYERKNPSNCPQCGSQRIRHYGTGTQKVESETGIIPEARTLRWDYETTLRKVRMKPPNYFIAHRADVLIGTQI